LHRPVETAPFSRNYETLLVRDAGYLANVEKASAGTNRTDEP
jgi:hypothetical protein